MLQVHRMDLATFQISEKVDFGTRVSTMITRNRCQLMPMFEWLKKALVRESKFREHGVIDRTGFAITVLTSACLLPINRFVQEGKASIHLQVVSRCIPFGAFTRGSP